MRKGFDISAWQADADGDPLFNYERFTQAKEEGNEFVIVKLGEYFNVDKFFYAHVMEALRAGLKVGVYYFSHALNEETAQEEADFVEETLTTYGFTNWHLQAGIWYDYEETDELKNMIWNGEITAQQMTNCISRFVNALWSKGREKVGVYGNYSLLWDNTYIYSQLPSVPVWVAQYGDWCDYPGATMWQYTDRGDVAGVTVDCNYLLEGF